MSSRSKCKLSDMKKILLVILACVLMSAAPHKEKTFKDLLGRQDTTEVEICHKHAHAFVYRIVSQQSLPGHLKHGDFLYRGRPDVELWEMTDWCNINAPEK